MNLEQLISWHRKRAESVLKEKDCCERCAQGKVKFHNDAVALLEGYRLTLPLEEAAEAARKLNEAVQRFKDWEGRN